MCYTGHFIYYQEVALVGDSPAPKSSQGVTGLLRFLGHLLQKNKIYDSQMVFYFIIPVRFSLTQCSN